MNCPFLGRTYIQYNIYISSRICVPLRVLRGVGSGDKSHWNETLSRVWMEPKLSYFTQKVLSPYDLSLLDG
jgi:hypothetical protein